MQFRSASINFADRNLDRAVSFLNGYNHYQVINARSDQVYLLNVKVVDSVTGLPVKDLETQVGVKGTVTAEPVKCVTDSEGSATFFLDKGSFQLVLGSADAFANYNTSESLSYEFEMTKPGKE
jgi:hypothetical protein